jgi:hypothetical protein
MLRKRLAAAAIGGASLLAAVTVVTAGSALGAGGGSWQVLRQLQSTDAPGVSDVVAVGEASGWAFDGPTAWQRDGSSWTPVPFPAKAWEEVIAAGASSASNVWAFTANPLGAHALHWNGSSWAVAGTFARGRPIDGAVVLGPNDVWVFGDGAGVAPAGFPGSPLGSWHYNGRSWSPVAGGSTLAGGSALSPDDIWAYGGTDVAHWNGRGWTRTPVASLLPASRGPGSNPELTGIYAQSPDSVYAVGNSYASNDGGPVTILHYDGSSWTRVAEFGHGYSTQIASDGHGGLWLPLNGAVGGGTIMLHYSGGRLTAVALPDPSGHIFIDTVSLIPGSTSVLGGGYYGSSADHGAGVIAQYQG